MPKESTKSRILHAAHSLIGSKGANGISYADISEIVDIRKASIHHHFPAKHDLMKELVYQHSCDFFTRLNAIKGENAIEKLKGYFQLFEQTFDEGKGGAICLFGMLGAEIQSLDAGTASEVKLFYEKNLSALTHIISTGLQDKTIRHDENPLELARVIFSTLEGAMIIVRADGNVSNYHLITKKLLNMVSNPKDDNI